MVPIRLGWTRPTDGVECVNRPIEGIEGGNNNIDVRPRSDRTDDVTYDVVDLENPMVVRFLNAVRDDDQLAVFLSRFGMLTRAPTMRLEYIKSLQTPFVLALVHNNKAGPLDRVKNINYFLNETSLRPSFESTGGVSKLVFHPNSLISLMAMEVALAHEAGAVSTSCAHCGTLYLTGPLTGRRSHSVYCSDRCRVAAMRKRKGTSNVNS